MFIVRQSTISTHRYLVLAHVITPSIMRGVETRQRHVTYGAPRGAATRFETRDEAIRAAVRDFLPRIPKEEQSIAIWVEEVTPEGQQVPLWGGETIRIEKMAPVKDQALDLGDALILLGTDVPRYNLQRRAPWVIRLPEIGFVCPARAGEFRASHNHRHSILFGTKGAARGYAKMRNLQRFGQVDILNGRDQPEHLLARARKTYGIVWSNKSYNLWYRDDGTWTTDREHPAVGAFIDKTRADDVRLILRKGGAPFCIVRDLGTQPSADTHGEWQAYRP